MSRTIVIGDIHACRDELFALLDKVGANDDDRIVSVGDLVDRGPDPAGVLDWFQRRPNAVVVCGNHERKHVRQTFSRSQEITRAQLGDRYEAAVGWMGTLPYHWSDGEILVVHAATIPGMPVDEVPPEILSGTTSGSERLAKRLGGRDWTELYEGPLPVVFGHRVLVRPLAREGLVYGIDTGACHGRTLTALVLPSYTLVSVPARADHWRTVNRQWEVPVLAGQRWTAMPFEQIERKVRDLATHAGPDGQAYLGRVHGWSQAVLDAIPSLATALDHTLATLDEPSLIDHPASAVLLRRRAGRLSDRYLGCSTPAQVLALGAQLGLPIPEPPPG